MNTTYQDNSVHNSDGIIVTNGNFGSITVLQGKTDCLSISSWLQLEKDIQMVLKKIENTQNEEMKPEFLIVEKAINNKDESKLKSVAKVIGKAGIDILTGLSANVLADFLTRSL